MFSIVSGCLYSKLSYLYQIIELSLFRWIYVMVGAKIVSFSFINFARARNFRAHIYVHCSKKLARLAILMSASAGFLTKYWRISKMGEERVRLDDLGASKKHRNCYNYDISRASWNVKCIGNWIHGTRWFFVLAYAFKELLTIWHV